MTAADASKTSAKAIAAVGLKPEAPPNKAPIMDAFGNPLELPAHISPHKVFELVDQALPFEVCLYHRVLPLSIEGKQLHLGMVDIHDEQALDYVSRIAAYSDRHLTTVPLAGHIHQVLLSAYLHHNSQPAGTAAITETAPERDETISSLNNPSPKPQPSTETLPPTPSLGIESSTPQSLEEWELETLFPSDTTVQDLGQNIGQSQSKEEDEDIAPPQSTISHQPSRHTQTLDVEQPSHLETRPMSEVKAQSIIERRKEPSPAISQRMTLILDETEIMAELAQASEAKLSEPPTLIEGQASRAQQELAKARPNLPRDIVEEIPSLTANPALPACLDGLSHCDENQQSWETIAHLPSNLLLQAMLGRMLQGNITRLRMERYRRPQTNGDLAQILWNQSGVLQTVWNKFSLGTFGALAKALRELAQLPLGPIQRPIQRGVMRRYQGQPILLLMQFLPDAKVAAIELRLLQGPALREFQKHQGQDLGREALLTAQTLQHQIQQLLDHHQLYPESSQIPEHLVTVIRQLEKAIAQQSKL